MRGFSTAQDEKAVLLRSKGHCFLGLSASVEQDTGLLDCCSEQAVDMA
jgi:hypothetical protein